MILVEMSREQREFIATAANARMDAIVKQDSNAWTTGEYAALESLVTQLYVECAE
jgi:hypothetical protein